jgi:hypothetical protein
MTSWTHATRLSVLTLSLALPAAAAATRGGSDGSAERVTVEEVAFPRGLAAGSDRLELRGAALLKYLFFDVYVAALYLPEGVEAALALDDVPKRLEISYLMSIDGPDFGPAAEKILRRSFSPEQLAPLRQRLEWLASKYRDIRPGDRYALTYLPGVGTELSLNGERIAVVEGSDFAQAYFAIWLGEKPIDRGFRERLLGRR